MEKMEIIRAKKQMRTMCAVYILELKSHNLAKIVYDANNEADFETAIQSWHSLYDQFFGYVSAMRDLGVISDEIKKKALEEFKAVLQDIIDTEQEEK